MHEETVAEILIVDDMLFNIEAIKILLRNCRKGFINKFESALDGQEAIDKVDDHIKQFGEKSPLKLILMDCNMPKKDGYEASQEILKLYSEAGIKPPLICAVTGHTEDSYLLKAKNSGIYRVICKPAQEKDIK